VSSSPATHPYRGAATGGFSLLELLVVLMIVAIMMGLLSMSVSRGVSGAEVRNASRQIAAGMRYTRSLALRTKQAQRFIVDVEDKSWQAGDREEKRLPEGMEVELFTAREEMLDETRGAIRFFPDGSATGGRVTVSAGEREWDIGVEWLTGEITQGEPDRI